MVSNSKAHKLLTTTEVAHLIAVSRRTVCLWAECQELPALKIGHQWRFRPPAIEKWIAARDNHGIYEEFPVKNTNREHGGSVKRI